MCWETPHQVRGDAALQGTDSLPFVFACMLVRAAAETDADAVARVHFDAWLAAYRGLLPDRVIDGLRLETFETRWRERLALGVLDTLVAERGDELLGFATIGPGRDDDALPDQGELYALYVHPGHWRTGVGRALWKQARAALQGHGFTEAVVWVLEANDRARRFYEQAGFVYVPDSGRPLVVHGAEVIEVQYGQTIDTRR